MDYQAASARLTIEDYDISEHQKKKLIGWISNVVLFSVCIR